MKKGKEVKLTRQFLICGIQTFKNKSFGVNDDLLLRPRHNELSFPELNVLFKFFDTVPTLAEAKNISRGSRG